MKSGTLSVRRDPTQGNLIPLPDKIIHLHKVLLVVAIDSEKAVRMFDDNQVAITGNRVAAVDDPARGRGGHPGAGRDSDLYTLGYFLPLGAEFMNDLPFNRPCKKALDWLGRF